MNAIEMLKQDHAEVEALFERFEALGPGDGAEKRRIADQVIEKLSVHAEVEEQVFYPAARSRLEEAGVVLEALEEHHLAKFALWELEKLPATAPRFDAKFGVLAHLIREHVEEEEGELFPQVEKAFPASELDALGQTMRRARAVAPNRPHPLSPDQPPLNTFMGLPVAAMDRVVTVGKRLVRSALGR